VVVCGERHENGFGVTRRREWFAGRAGAVSFGHGDGNGACMHTNWFSPKPCKVFNSCSFAGTTCSAVHPVLVSIRGAAAYVDKSEMRRAAAQPAAAVTSQ